MEYSINRDILKYGVQYKQGYLKVYGAQYKQGYLKVYGVQYKQGYLKVYFELCKFSTVYRKTSTSLI